MTLEGVVYGIDILYGSRLTIGRYVTKNAGSATDELENIFNGIYGPQTGTRSLNGPSGEKEVRRYWRVKSDNRIELYQYYIESESIALIGYRYTCKGFEKRKLDAEAKATSIQNKQKASGVKL